MTGFGGNTGRNSNTDAGQCFLKRLNLAAEIQGRLISDQVTEQAARLRAQCAPMPPPSRKA